MTYEKKYTIDDLIKDCNKYHKALKEIQRIINLAYRVEDYQLGQDYTDLVNRIDKELEVLNA